MDTSPLKVAYKGGKHCLYGSEERGGNGGFTREIQADDQALSKNKYQDPHGGKPRWSNLATTHECQEYETKIREYPMGRARNCTVVGQQVSQYESSFQDFYDKYCCFLSMFYPGLKESISRKIKVIASCPIKF